MPHTNLIINKVQVQEYNKIMDFKENLWYLDSYNGNIDPDQTYFIVDDLVSFPVRFNKLKVNLNRVNINILWLTLKNE